MIKISASIVIYNEQKEVLKRAINSFFNLDFEKELLIVDNYPDSVLELFCKNFKNIKYILSKENIGFGSGHNLAFKNKTIDSDIHIIINPDTYFKKEQLEGFIEWFYEEKDVSLAVPSILNPDGSLQSVVRNIPTPLSLVKRKLSIDLDEIAVEKNTIKEIPFAHGCFMVFETEVLKNIKGFDERFFMYMEDVDIFIRAKQYGLTVMNSNFSVYHEYRKGSSKNLKLLWWHIISAVKFFIKYK